MSDILCERAGATGGPRDPGTPSQYGVVARRLVRLYVGLALGGFGLALTLVADLGAGPWDVFHDGLADRTGIPVGRIVIFVGAAVLALWVPLGERPGFGTLSNVVVVGVAIDATIAAVPDPIMMAARVGYLVAGVVLAAVATGLYVGAGFGPGPRDGLMTGLARRGLSIRAARTGIEVAALVVGVLLGGSFGAGTVLFAVTIGPLVQFFLPRLASPDFTVPTGPGPTPAADSKRRTDPCTA